MSDPQPSALPWKAQPCNTSGCGWPQIIAADGSEVIVSHPVMSDRISDADADLIVRAANLHSELEGLLAIALMIADTECKHDFAFKLCVHRRASAVLDILKPKWRDK